MVRWQAYDGEAGWYRTGAYNVFTLTVSEDANYRSDIQHRKEQAQAQSAPDDLVHKTKAGYM